MRESRLTRPPAFTRQLVGRLLRRLLGSDDAEALLGDLEEDFRRAAAADERTARRGYRRDAWRSLVALLPRGLGRRRAEVLARPAVTHRESPLSAFALETRRAARMLRRQPGFALVVVLTLALGLGAATAVFSVLDDVLLKPLRFAEPDRLVHLWGYDVTSGRGRSNLSYPDFEDLRDEVDGLAAVAAYQVERAGLVDGASTPTRIDAAFVSHSLFETLGLRVARGRDLDPADDRRGAEPVVVLSHGLWRTRYGGDPEILGRRVRLGDTERTVVGVADAGVVFPEGAQVWAPIEPRPGTEVRGVHNLKAVARLADSAAADPVDAGLATLATRLEADYPRSNAARGLRTEPLQEALVQAQRPRLLLLFAAAGLLLLVACANVTGLLMERAVGRGREVATRAALGASRLQLARGFAAEAMLLVGCAVGIGMGFAWLGQRAIVHFAPEMPRLAGASLDLRAFGFAAVAAALTALALSQMPLLEAWRREIAAMLAAGGRGGSDGQGRQRLRRLVVIGEIALAVLLVTGAGHLLRSFERLAAVDLGFEPDNVLVIDLDLPKPFISEDWPETVAFYDSLFERLDALPGVESVAAGHMHPAKRGWETSFTIDGLDRPPEGYEPEASFRPVTEGFFETAGIRLLRGRTFDARDRSESDGVVVVNQAFVDEHLPAGADPLGWRLRRDNWWIATIETLEIIGVVETTRFSGRDGRILPAMYLFHAQHPTPAMSVLVRTRVDPWNLRQSAADAVWALAPDLPIDRFATLGDLVADTVAARRLLTWLLGLFAALALGLAALGVYGVLAYATARRTRELGLRMALGAARPDLVRLVLRQGLGLTAVGLALGLGGSLAAGRLLDAFLFDTRATEPMTLLAVVGLLALTALAAAYLPARRAAGLDPSRALQEE
ncbi:MAG: ADOP family duplicated permease [Acidobacteriota bacterium]